MGRVEQRGRSYDESVVKRRRDELVEAARGDRHRQCQEQAARHQMNGGGPGMNLDPVVQVCGARSVQVSVIGQLIL